jgi:mRNA interferase MazF
MFQPCEVVVLPFPFSDLRSTKRRPALIRRSLVTYGDIVALAITSRSGHPAGVPLDR